MITVTKNAGESGNFTVPPGVNWLKVTMWGGGGSGQATRYALGLGYARGGGGAGVIENWIYTVTPGELIAYAVGSGGAAVEVPASDSTYGNAGGNTTFGTMTAYAGGAGAIGFLTGGAATADGHTADGGDSTEGEDGATYDHGDGGKLYGGGAGNFYLVGHDGVGGDSKSAGGIGETYAADENAGGGGGSYGVGGVGKARTTSAGAGVQGGGGGGCVQEDTGYFSGAGGGGYLIIQYQPPLKCTIPMF